MAKDTNTSRCREVVYGCSVRPFKALTNDGFKISFDVVTTGFIPDHAQVRSLSKCLEKIIVNRCNYLSAAKAIGDMQRDLFDIANEKESF